jgi:hypothetical protein
MSGAVHSLSVSKIDVENNYKVESVALLHRKRAMALPDRKRLLTRQLSRPSFLSFHRVPEGVID